MSKVNKPFLVVGNHGINIHKVWFSFSTLLGALECAESFQACDVIEEFVENEGCVYEEYAYQLHQSKSPASHYPVEKEA